MQLAGHLYDLSGIAHKRILRRHVNQLQIKASLKRLALLTRHYKQSEIELQPIEDAKLQGSLFRNSLTNAAELSDASWKNVSISFAPVPPLVLKRNDLCQESIHSRRSGSDGANQVKSLEV
jgi:hypothetical protein